MAERVDDSSTIPALQQVTNEIGQFKRWFPLGLRLQLDSRCLHAIMLDGQNVEMRCILMVESWLDSKSNPSWGELCQALQEMNEHALADRIARKYCPDVCAKSQQPKPAIPCEQPPPASNDPLVERQLPQVPEDDDDASKKKSFNVEVEFAFLFATVVSRLGKTTDVDILKTFLESLCDSKTHLPYVSPKLYEHYNTTAEVLRSLRPQIINSMHLYLLKKIVDKFGCDQAKELVRQYDTNFPRDIPLKRLGDPLTDEEIEACIGTKKLKVVIDDDPNGVTKRDVEAFQRILEKNTGIPLEVVVYAKHTPGSVVLMFLIPEGTAVVFTNLTRNGLLFLVGSGVIRIELDVHVVDILNDLRKEMRQELVPFPSERRVFSSSPSHYHSPRSVPVFRSDPPFVHRSPRSVPVFRSDPSHQTRTGPDSGYSSGVGSKTSSAIALFSKK